jgi:hypothetical protein
MTQGLLDIVSKKTGKMLFKIVCGSDGYNVDKLAKKILDYQKNRTTIVTLKALYQMALAEDFGCEDCLVVLGINKSEKVIAYCGDNDIEFSDLYYKTFYKKKFNPRWKSGLVDEYKLIKI